LNDQNDGFKFQKLMIENENILIFYRLKLIK